MDIQVMQIISPFYLKTRYECTKEMTFGDNEYYNESINLLTKYYISTTFFAYTLIFGAYKKAVLTELTYDYRLTLKRLKYASFGVG